MTKISISAMKILDHPNNSNNRYKPMKRHAIISLLIWSFGVMYAYSLESLPKGKLFSQKEIIAYGKQQLNSLLDTNELNGNAGDTSCNQYIYFTKNIDLPIEKVQEYVWAENYQDKQEQFKKLNDELKRINQGLVAPMYIGINLDIGRIVVDTKISSRTQLSVLHDIQLEEHQRDLKEEVPKALNKLYRTINESISTGTKKPISIHVLGFFQIFYSEGVKNEVFLNTWRAQHLTMKNFKKEQRARVKRALKQGGTIGFFIDDKKNIKQESAQNYLNRYRAAVQKYWDDDIPDINYAYTYNNITTLEKWYQQDRNDKELNPFVPSANNDQRVYDYTGLFYSYKSQLEEYLNGYKNVKENYKVVLTDVYTPHKRIVEIDRVLREGNYKGSVIRIHINDEEKVIQQNIYRDGTILNLDPTLSRRIQEFGDLVFSEGFSAEKALLIMLEMKTIIIQFNSVVFGGFADGLKAVKIPKEFWDSASPGYYFKEIESLVEGIPVIETQVVYIQHALALITGAYNGLVDTLATVPDLAGKVMDLKLFVKRILSDDGYRKEVTETVHKITSLLKQPEIRDFVWMLASNQLQAMWDKEYNKVAELGDYTGVYYFAGNIVFAVAVGILSGGSSTIPKVAKDFLTFLRWVLEPMDFLRKITGKKLNITRPIVKLMKKGYTITKDGVVMIGKEILFTIKITGKIIKVAHDAIIKPGNSGMYAPELSLAIPEGYTVEGISLKDRWIHIMKGSDGSHGVSGDAADDWLRFTEDLGDDWDKLIKQEFIDEVTTTHELKELFLEADYDEQIAFAKGWKLLKIFPDPVTRENVELISNISQRFEYKNKKGEEGLELILPLIKKYEFEDFIKSIKKASKIFDTSVSVTFSAKKLGETYVIIVLDDEKTMVCRFIGDKISKKRILAEGKLVGQYKDLEIYQNGQQIGFIGDPEWKVTQIPEGGISYKNAELGKKISDEGAYKRVYEIAGEPDKIIAILKEGKQVSTLNEEINALQVLSDKGFPTVEIIEKTTHNGHPCIVMKRYALGSEEIIEPFGDEVKIKGTSELLNSNSINSLMTIREKMVRQEIMIEDLQFLITKDGSFVIADPLGIKLNHQPSEINLKLIDALIEQTKKAIEDNSKFSWSFLNTIEGWDSGLIQELQDFVAKTSEVAKLFEEAVDDIEKIKLANAWKHLYDYPEFRSEADLLRSYVKVVRIGEYNDLAQPLLESKLIPSFDRPRLGEENKVKEIEANFLANGYNVEESIQVMKLPDGTLLVAGIDSNYKLIALKNLGQEIIPVDIRSFNDVVADGHLKEAMKAIFVAKFLGKYKGGFIRTSPNQDLHTPMSEAIEFVEKYFPLWKDDFIIGLTDVIGKGYESALKYDLKLDLKGGMNNAGEKISETLIYTLQLKPNYIKIWKLLYDAGEDVDIEVRLNINRDFKIIDEYLNEHPNIKHNKLSEEIRKERGWENWKEKNIPIGYTLIEIDEFSKIYVNISEEMKATSLSYKLDLSENKNLIEFIYTNGILLADFDKQAIDYLMINRLGENLFKFAFMHFEETGVKEIHVPKYLVENYKDLLNEWIERSVYLFEDDSLKEDDIMGKMFLRYFKKYDDNDLLALIAKYGNIKMKAKFEQDLGNEQFSKLLAYNPNLIKPWEYLYWCKDLPDAVRRGEKGELEYLLQHIQDNPAKTREQLIQDINEAEGYDAWKKNLTAADDDYKNIIKLGKNNTPVIVDDSAKNVIKFLIDFENEIHEIASFELRNGTLIQFVNIEDKFKLKDQGIGKGMFRYAFDRLGGTNTIDRIPDKYINRELSDNFDSFKESILDGLTPEQAALLTPTGKWVKDKYPFVKIDPSIVDKIKNSSSTDLIVVKPEFVKTAVESVRPEYLESLRKDIEKFPGYFVDNEALEGWKVLRDLKIECTKENLDFLQNYSQQNPDKKWNWISDDIHQKGSWKKWVASLEGNSSTGALWKISKLKPGEKSYKDVKLLDRIGYGEHKEVFPILGEEDKVVVILKKGKTTAILNKEIEALKILSEKGYPTVEILQKTTHHGQPAIVMKRYKESSGGILKSNRSNVLNAKSIEELQTIRERIKEKEFVITDLQFLIGKNGTVVIADPILFFNVSSPEFIEANIANNYSVIDELIYIAKRNMGIELENPVWEYTKDIKGWTKEINDEFVNFVDKNPDIGDLFRTADNDLERKKLAQSWLLLKDYPEFCKDSKILNTYSKITRIGKYSDDVQPMRIDDISTQGFLDDPNKIKKQQDFIKMIGYHIGEAIKVKESLDGTLIVADNRSYYRLRAMQNLDQLIVPIHKYSFWDEVNAQLTDFRTFSKDSENKICINWVEAVAREKDIQKLARVFGLDPAIKGKKMWSSGKKYIAKYSNTLAKSDFDLLNLKLLDNKARKPYEIYVKDGELYNQEIGRLSSYTESYSAPLIFVMDANGKIYAGKYEENILHPSSFLHSGDVVTAGQFEYDVDRTLIINVKGEHYQSNVNSLKELVEELTTRGFNIWDIVINTKEY